MALVPPAPPLPPESPPTEPAPPLGDAPPVAVVRGTDMPEPPHAKANPATSTATRREFKGENMVFMVPKEVSNVHAGRSIQ